MDHQILEKGKTLGFDSLEGYLRFILSISVSDFLLVPYNAVNDFGTDMTSIVLHRTRDYQTELFIAPREWKTTKHSRNYHFADGGRQESIGQHRHPNVDSYEVPLCGQIDFYVNGKPISTPERIRAISPRGQSGVYGSYTRILPTDWHGAAFGSGGGAFMSVQHWLNGVPPSSVGLDWEGEHDA